MLQSESKNRFSGDFDHGGLSVCRPSYLIDDVEYWIDCRDSVVEPRLELDGIMMQHEATVREISPLAALVRRREAPEAGNRRQSALL